MELSRHQIVRLSRIILKAIEIFKSESKTSSLAPVLFLLELKREGILNQTNVYENDFNLCFKFDNFLLSQSDPKNKTIKSVWNVVVNEFVNINPSTFHQVMSIIDEINFNELGDVYSEVFDELLKDYVSKKYETQDLITQPIEITKLIYSLCDTTNKQIYNPFAGLASYIVDNSKVANFFAEEINSKTWAIGALRILAHNQDANEYIMQDSFFNLTEESSLFDLIVSTPPFNAQIVDANLWIKEFDRPCKFEDYYLYHGVDCIKTDGKLIGLFSPGVLFRDGVSKEIRKKIIHSGYLNMVIKLPPYLFSNNSLAPVIMILDKSKSRQREVKFVDATTFFKKQGRGNILDYSGILSSIKNQDTKFVQLVSLDEIIENDYLLSVKRYFHSDEIDLILPKGHKLTSLGKISNIQSTNRFNDEFGRVVKTSDLAENIEFSEKKSTDFASEPLSGTIKKIQSNTLLISKIRNLKPTFCYASEIEPIFCNINILPLAIDEKIVDKGYLILELNSERVRNYVNSRLTDGSIQTISIKDILEIPIILPSLDEQKAKYAGFLEAIAKKKKDDLIAFSKIHGLENEIYEQNTFLRHSLAGPVSNIDGIVENMKTILNNYSISHPEILNLKVTENHKFSLNEYLNKLSRDISKISATIKKQLISDLTMKDYPLEMIEAKSFLQNYTEEYNENKKPDFTLLFECDENYFDLFEAYDTGEVYFPKIKVNKNLLKDLLDNLIENAIKHAFTSNCKNRIEILLMGVTEDENKPELQILVSNTGNPLPENFTINEFCKKGNAVGASAGTGFGGWYISEIVKFFNGSIDLIDETGSEGIPESDLATSFEINLPVVYEEKL